MIRLEKNNKIKKNIVKKRYSQPLIKEIGRVHNVTKGSGASFQVDSNWPSNPFDPTQS